eukprot:7381313-Prymnesium_polylepis.2
MPWWWRAAAGAPQRGRHNKGICCQALIRLELIAEHRKGEVNWEAAGLWPFHQLHIAVRDIDGSSRPAWQIFGEISCMFRKKCEASVRARTSLDVISLPRKEMMEVLSKNDQMKSDFLKLIQTRR